MRLRFSFRKHYFTFWHFRRTPSYTESNRQRMSEDRYNYLDHLERWLNYGHNIETPQIARAVLPPKPRVEPMPRKRVDSFVDEERRKVAREVAAQNVRMGAAKSKCVADLGKVSRMEIVAPLPSCAQDEDDEGFAGGPLEQPRLMQTMIHKIKDLLGVRYTP